MHALSASGNTFQDIDAVVVRACSGYICPGLSGHVVQRLGLRNDVLAYDLVGQGARLPCRTCSSARPSCLRFMHTRVVICVEVSSAAMYLDNDPGVVISVCLFDEGAGAAVLSRQAPPTARVLRWVDSTSLVESERRATLMFEQCGGTLSDILMREVRHSTLRPGVRAIRTTAAEAPCPQGSRRFTGDDSATSLRRQRTRAPAGCEELNSPSAVANSPPRHLCPCPSVHTLGAGPLRRPSIYEPTFARDSGLVGNPKTG
jgi:hypothetical protein